MSEYPAHSVHGPARIGKSLAPSAAWNSAVLIPVFHVPSTYVSYRSSSGILLSWYHRHSSLGVKKQLSIYLQIYTPVSQTCACACDLINHHCVCFAAVVFVAVGAVSTRHTRKVFVSVVAISSPFDWRKLNARILLLPAAPGMSVFSLHPPFGFAPSVTRSSRVIDQSSCGNAGWRQTPEDIILTPCIVRVIPWASQSSIGLH